MIVFFLGHGEYTWTEWFKSFHGNTSQLHHSDYDVPLAVVKDWMQGPTGMDKAAEQSMDSFLEELSTQAPTKEEIIYQGSPWGALYEFATGTKLARGITFNLTETDTTRPWIELLRDGTFSEATLAVDPTSFEIDPQWVKRLYQSLEKGHKTWLHYLFLGTAHLEYGEKTKAYPLLQDSMAMRPSVHAARALAVSAGSVEEALAFFLQAWEIYETDDGKNIHLGTNLAMELSLWLTYQGQWDALENWFASKHVTALMLTKDRVLHAQAALALHKGDYEAVQKIVSSHCWPTYGNDRSVLITMWEESYMMQERAKFGGRNLTYFEQVQVRRRIGCVGDASFDAFGCNRGPPNVGYPY